MNPSVATAVFFFVSAVSAYAQSPQCQDIYTKLTVNGVPFLNPYAVSATADGLYVSSPEGEFPGKKYPQGQKHYFSIQPNGGGAHIWCYQHRVKFVGPDNSKLSCPPPSSTIMLNGDDGKSVIGQVEIDSAKNTVVLYKNSDPMASHGTFSHTGERIELQVKVSTDPEGKHSELTTTLTAYDKSGNNVGSFENQKSEVTSQDDPDPAHLSLALGDGKNFKRKAQCQAAYEESRDDGGSSPQESQGADQPK